MTIYHSGSLKVSKDTRVFGVSRVVVHEAFGNKGYPLPNGIDFGEERDSLPFIHYPFLYVLDEEYLEHPSTRGSRF